MGIETALIIGAVASASTAAYSIYSGEKAKKKAKSDAAAADAKLKKQEDLIAKEEAKQEKVAGERKERLSQRQLLTGSEVGITGEEVKPSLLGAST